MLAAFDAFDQTIESLASLLFAGWKPSDRDRWRSLLAEEYRDSQLPWLACDKS